MRWLEASAEWFFAHKKKVWAQISENMSTFTQRPSLYTDLTMFLRKRASVMLVSGMVSKNSSSGEITWDRDCGGKSYRKCHPSCHLPEDVADPLTCD